MASTTKRSATTPVVDENGVPRPAKKTSLHPSTAADFSPVDTVCINSIRALAAALPQAANSGHPGAPMGCAPIAHVLFGYVMNFTPREPKWWNRDRFVLSNGHACALQYTMLHLAGYDLALEDLKNFRQLHSKTPGHPECGMTPGIEVTTGPLGQGISNAVGLAIASQHLSSRYNKEDITLFDNFTYVLCGDGCLEEGVSSEASSLAGHLKLGRLIVLYDSNHISIDGNTALSFSENVKSRYEAYGWHVEEVEDADTNPRHIHEAVLRAQQIEDKPSMIICSTTIGYGSSKQGTAKTHGAPLGMEDLMQVRQKFGLEGDMWSIAPDVVDFYKKQVEERGIKEYQNWTKTFDEYKKNYPVLAAELERRFSGQLPQGWKDSLPSFGVNSKPEPTRGLSHQCLNSLAPILPELMGGSADLTESNKTDIKGESDFLPESYTGRYLRFGVREHGMMALANGLFAYGGMLPYVSTFLNFITYAWGAFRLAALSRFGVLFVATHDSIELGEDGPTHQPIEVLPLCRATPNVLTVRPADGRECSGGYAVWLTNRTRPTVLALCRSNVPPIDGSDAEKVALGAYIVDDFDATRLNQAGSEVRRVILAGSGSELHLCVAAKSLLESRHPPLVVRIVSMPCWELFEEQSDAYRSEVLPAPSASLALLYCEAASTFGWDKYFNLKVGMSSFGVSAPKAAAWKELGFTKENIANTVLKHFSLPTIQEQ